MLIVNIMTNIKSRLRFAYATVWLNKYIAERGHLYMLELRDSERWLLIRLLRVSIRTGSNLGLTFPKLIERDWNGVHVCICALVCWGDYGIRLWFDNWLLYNFSCITRSSSSVNFWSQDWLLTGFQWVCPTTVLSSFRTAPISSAITAQHTS